MLAIQIEHKVAWICSKQTQVGFSFDTEKAVKLYAKLKTRQNEVHLELSKHFPGWFRKDGKACDAMPKVSNKVRGTTKGVPYTKVKFIVFNPASRDHIADRLIKVFKWKPTQFTDSGKPELNEETISTLPAPFKDLLNEYLMLDKRIGQLAEGKNAWLRLEKQGRVHGSINPNGAVTGRATHSAPNIGQVPATDKPYGCECRELFRATLGNVLVGSDLSGIELRLLAHYMAHWDKGEYALVILEGDIHTVNQTAAGLPTRDDAKTFIYGWLYGAGDEKIGQIVGKGRKEGKRLKEQFLNGIPALSKLRDAVSKKAKTTGILRGLDGRKLPIRHAHAALNTLLQGAGAVIAKQWLIFIDEAITSENLRASQVAFVHDEVQIDTHPQDAPRVAKICIEAAIKAGEYFNLRIPIQAESKIGNNWKETH